MKLEEMYLLFLEETLELLPLIQAGLREVSQEYNQLGSNSNKVHSGIADLLPLLDALNLGGNQVREARSTNGDMPSNIVHLDRLQSLIDNLQNLLTSFLEQTPKNRLVKLKQLWQIYIRLKYSLLTCLSQVPSGQLGILAKGEFLFSFAQFPKNLAASTRIDTNLQEAIVDKDMVQSLADLELILDSPNLAEQSIELKHQADIFFGLGELLELKDLIAIAESVTIGLENNSSATQLIGQRALACWHAVQTALSRNTTNYQAEDWRNYLFLVEGNQALIPTSVSAEIKPEQIPHISEERILKTEQFFMWLSGYNIFFFAANLVFAMVIPQANQIKYLDKQQIFIWQEQNIPLYQLSDLLKYNYFLPDDSRTHPSLLILVVKHHVNLIALEIGVEQPLVESSLTLKSFAPILTTPNYVCGCTLLGNDHLKVVIDVQALLNQWFDE